MAIGVYCLEVGQGQCIALIGPSPDGNQAALIDIGIRGERLTRRLEAHEVRRISLVVLTHNHADHIKGLTALIESFTGEIRDVCFVVDQAHERIAPWFPLQKWVNSGKIRSANTVYPPSTSRPGEGRRLLAPDLAGFQLFCIYPTIFEADAIAHDAPLLGTHPGHNANAASAILRLARADEPGRTIALFGGDLTFRGWQRLDEQGYDLSAEVLVVPHHGSSHGASEIFGPAHLAGAVRPRYALFSVGTENSFGHPSAEIVRSFHGLGSTILCTQITGHCIDCPEFLPDGSVLARRDTEPNLAGRGVACAGTIVVQVPDTGPVNLLRLVEHQTAIDRFLRATGRPMCRP